MRFVQITLTGLPPFSAQLADRFLPRLLGLMGRALKPGDALLLSPCNQIHCFFMKSAIDVAYLSQKGEILALTHAMTPGSVGRGVKGAVKVLELYSGDAHRLGLAPGQILEIGERL